MKLNVLKVSAIALLQAVAFQSFSQIVINRQNFPAEDRLKEPVPRYIVSNSSLGVLAEGSGETWDFSNENISEKNVLVYKENDNTGPLASANYRSVQENTISGFPYRTGIYYEVNENGSYEIGRYQYDTTHSLAMITGNPDDIANIPDMAVPYSEPSVLLEFPAQMGNSFSSAANMRVYYNLTISAFNLNEVPFYTQQTRILEREVVGEGTLIVPSENGGDPLEVQALMVKLKSVYIDSTFSGDDNEAPPALLNAFGAKQGDTSNYEEGYFFVTPDFGFSIADVYLNDDGEVDEIYITPSDYLKSTGIGQRVNHTEHTVFPTVLKAGSQFNLRAANQDILFVELIDINGRQKRLHAQQNGAYTIPQGSNAGIYIYRGMTSTGDLLRGKILVRP